MVADSAPDWLGACRRSAEAIRLMLADHPTIAERVMETGTRGEGGDRTLVIDEAAEDVVFAELENAPRRRRALHARSARSAASSTSARPGPCSSSSTRSTARSTPSAGCRTTRSRSRSRDGDTMADVVFGFVQDFGPAEEWVAWRGEGAQLDGVPLDPSLTERRTARRQARGARDRVRRPALGRPVRRRARRDRPPAARDRRDRRLAVPGRGRPLRRDGVVERCRAVDVAAAQLIVREAGGQVAFIAYDDPLGRAAGPRAALAGHRRAHRRGARGRSRPSRSGRSPRGAGRPRRHRPIAHQAAATLGTASLPSIVADPPLPTRACCLAVAPGRPGLALPSWNRVIDWKLAGTVARGVANMQPAGNPEPFEQLAEPAVEAERLVSAYTGLVRRAAGARRRGRRARRVGSTRTSTSLKTVLEPAVARVGGKLGPLGIVAGGVMAVEAGASPASSPGACSASTSSRCSQPDAPARLLFVAPNLAHAASGLDAPADQLLRWVALHEMTHALQFGGVPWLREHLAGKLRELLGALEMNPRSLFRVPDVTDLRKLVRAGARGRARDGRHRRRTSARRSTECRPSWPCSRATPSTSWTPSARTVLDDLPGLRNALQQRRRRPLWPAEDPRPAARDGPQAASVRAGQGVLRRGRRARRDRRSQPRLDHARRRCPHWPSWTTRRAGCAAPSRSSSGAPPSERTFVSAQTQAEVYGRFTRTAGVPATNLGKPL